MTAELSTTVAVLAGRRIDPPNVRLSCFPLDRVSVVKTALTEAFAQYQVTKLVCSAACGADLIALAVSEELGIRRRIILPFDVATFRKTSVVDRPGDWGAPYDRLVAIANDSGDLVILDCEPGDVKAYSRTNHAIIEEAASGLHRTLAFIVWEGRPRDGDDATAEFQLLAADAGFTVLAIPTC